MRRCRRSATFLATSATPVKKYGMRQDLLECRSRRNGVGTRKAGSFQPRCDGWWNAPLAGSRSGAGSPSPTSATSRTSSILLGSLSPASSPLASHARPRRAMSTIFAKHALSVRAPCFNGRKPHEMSDGNALAIANANRRRLDDLGMFSEGRFRLGIVITDRIGPVDKGNGTQVVVDGTDIGDRLRDSV